MSANSVTADFSSASVWSIGFHPTWAYILNLIFTNKVRKHIFTYAQKIFSAYNTLLQI